MLPPLSVYETQTRNVNTVFTREYTFSLVSLEKERFNCNRMCLCCTATATSTRVVEIRSSLLQAKNKRGGHERPSYVPKSVKRGGTPWNRVNTDPTSSASAHDVASRKSEPPTIRSFLMFIYIYIYHIYTICMYVCREYCAANNKAILFFAA